MVIMTYISDVTPSQELSDKGKNKTNGLNYAGPGMNLKSTGTGKNKSFIF